MSYFVQHYWKVQQFVHCLHIVFVAEKGIHVVTLLSKITNGSKPSFPENVKWIVELNQTIQCLYGLSKVFNTGIAEYINLENSELIREMIKKAIFACYPDCYSYHHYYYYITTFTVLRGNLNKIKTRDVYAHCQNSVSQELIWALSWNFLIMLKGEDHLNKRQYVHITANSTVTATFTTTTTTASIATACKAKSIEIKILRCIWTHRLSNAHISNVIAMAKRIKLKLPGFDDRCFTDQNAIC